MPEELLHGAPALLLDPQERIERCHDAPDEREVNPETDLHLRSIEGNIREHRPCDNGEENTLQRNDEPYEITEVRFHDVVPHQRQSCESKNEQVTYEDQKSDEGGIELEPGPHRRLPEPFSPEPRYENADERKKRSQVQDLLLDFKISNGPEERGSTHWSRE